MAKKPHSADKKAETTPAPKSESPPKTKDTPDASPPDASAPKAEGGEKTADVSANYSRGEGQKPVSDAYRDNWNAIYGKKKKKR